MGSVKTKRRVRYERPSGLAAIPPKAWGMPFVFDMAEGVDDPKFERVGAYAVVDVCGPLCKGDAWFGDSYDAIRDRAEVAFESDAEAVCLRIDSPGGDWAGCVELARDLRALADASGKRLVAFTDGECLSAAYAIATAADEIVATPQAFVGSVGVWAAHVDQTGMDAAIGLKVTIAASGPNKADWNPHVALTEEAFARLVTQVQAQAQVFFGLVAEQRGIDVAPVAALAGASVFGQAGIDVGLTDRLATSWSAFISDEEPSEETAMPPKGQASKYDEALGALKRAAEGDDEDAKKAKKALAAIEEPSEEEKKKKKDDEAAEEEEKKKKDDEAKALAASNLALAAKVQELVADAARRTQNEKAQAEAAERSKLFAKRPDFGPEVRAALETLPIAELEKAVKTFPRVTAAPSAAAAAMTPAVTGGGEPTPRDRESSYAGRLTPEQVKMLERSRGQQGHAGAAAAPAERVGNVLQMPRHLTPAQARARVAELDAMEKEIG